jgi:hypothetical protein
MFHTLAQSSADTLVPVAQFGVAGLMGGLWWWERKYSREREEQLTEAHKVIMSQREHLSTLLGALQNNTKAITEFTLAQRELVRALRQRAGAD